MTLNILLIPILLPLIAGVLVLLTPKKYRGVKEALAVVATLANLIIAVSLFSKNLVYSLPWAGFGIEFSLRLYHFSSFIIAATACFGFLIALYCVSFMRDKNYLGQFYAYLLLTLSFINGAVLADNLVLLLFFWEGSLLLLFGMIAIGRKDAFKTAIKMFVIVGIADLCMMAGIALTGYIAGTLTISKISLGFTPLAGLAFALLMIGAISKAGSVPFHTWIPDAAVDAPLPFMAFLPAALEKLLGIYFLTRISLDMFKLVPESWASYLLMIVGAITILVAVMMALVQKDYKKLLAYHAISQVGYMILGIGTALPVGIVGGLFHMINNALYKSCLFLTGGSVEKQAGTTDLAKLGGIGARMPVTFLCFFITAVSISGVPPFNGFFSKELIYDAALERNVIFYIAAALGSFFTAISFLKLGHAAYLGKISEENKKIKESPLAMLLPMVILAAICVIFGIYNAFPINKLIQPVLGAQAGEHHFAGFPGNMKIVIITVLVLLGAVASHIFGFKKTGSGLKAVDYIHYAPGFAGVYKKAEQGVFDPYNIGLKIVNVVSKIAWAIDKAFDWIYEKLAVGIVFASSSRLKRIHTGNYSMYIAWSMLGMLFVYLSLLFRSK